MSDISDRISYLKGLVEGLNLDMEKPEGKILDKVMDILGAMSDELDELRKDHEELDEYVESIDEDLSEIEEIVYGDEDEDGCDCGCGHCHHHDDEDEDDDEDGVVEYTCPHCGEEMTFEVKDFDFDDDYLCPNCHQPLFPGAEEEDGEEEGEDK